MDKIIKEKIGFFRGFSESGLELREVPEDLKESKLRYNVNVKLLGLIRHIKDDKYTYSPSIRRLPHLGAWVGVPTEEILKYICELGLTGDMTPATIGYMCFGDQVYDGVDKSPALPLKFELSHLIAKRTYVFARAGYGKSNLIKLLITSLYENTQPGGMIIFDPEGEYAFKDKKGRYGLLNVPALKDKIVVYTDRDITEEQKRWVAGHVRLNLSHLPPSDVVNICVSSSKQETVFANVLRGMDYNSWRELLQEIEREGYRLDDERIRQLTGISDRDTTSPQAIKNNLVPIVRRLHSSSSNLLEAIREHLKKGRIVIIDISLMSSGLGQELSGLILHRLFTQNQENFTEGSSGEVLPIISVIEEAQSVLSPKATDTSPFVVWAKEGRKYQLGSILVTQQPGAIAKQLLSQGDNFFSFHLISENDLRELQKVNAHFSDDILSAILNEPIKGNAYIWSAPDQPFVIGAKIVNFQKYVDEKIKNAGEEDIKETPAEEFSRQLPDLEKRFDKFLKEAITHTKQVKIYENISIDGKENNEVVATKFWNLKFGLTKVIGADLGRLFCEKPFEDSPPTVKDNAIFESLKRQNLLHSESTYVDGENKKYILLNKAAIDENHKDFDQTKLELKSS
jgi:hypothetical protein